MRRKRLFLSRFYIISSYFNFCREKMTSAIAGILEKALSEEGVLSHGELVQLLSIEDEAELQMLFAAACRMKERYIGHVVSLRGLIEISNICARNCFYCGIRSGNFHVKRFEMSREEILSAAALALKFNYGSVVIQGGERSSEEFTVFIEDVIRRIKKLGNIGITLSLGEQSLETYQRWFAAGAHRYLLRIETSDPELYASLHPADHSWVKRRRCLDFLRQTGFQLGTGTMSALPGQTIEQMAHDVEFFRQADADMIGMGPYLPHLQTPLGAQYPDYDREEKLRTALKMIAVTRLYLKDVNIASTTALQALAPDGRERGLLAGANVIMPNIGEVCYRPGYQLYENKPCLDENSAESREKLLSSLAAIGEKIADGWGDSPHFRRRKK